MKCFIKLIYVFVIFISLRNYADELSSEKCNSIQNYILQNFENGFLVRNKIYETVPYVRTSFKYEGRYVRVPINIVDVDNDGVYEALYLFDETSPMYITSRIYSLDAIADSQAQDLIKNKNKSAYYKELMLHLETQYKWDAAVDVTNTLPISVPVKDFFPIANNYDRDFRTTFFVFEKKFYLLIENLVSKDVAVISIVDLKNLRFSQQCSFKYPNQ